MQTSPWDQELRRLPARTPGPSRRCCRQPESVRTRSEGARCHRPLGSACGPRRRVRQPAVRPVPVGSTRAASWSPRRKPAACCPTAQARGVGSVVAACPVHGRVLVVEGVEQPLGGPAGYTLRRLFRARLGHGQGHGVGAVLHLSSLPHERADVDREGGESEYDTHAEQGGHDGRHRTALAAAAQARHELYPPHRMFPVAVRVGAGTLPPKKDGRTLRTSQWNWVLAAPFGMVIV